MADEESVTRRLKLRQLNVLLSVIQWGSMARAAEHLSVSQPVVSKTIAELEGSLGVRLLDRTSQGVEPTIYGHALAHLGFARCPARGGSRCCAAFPVASAQLDRQRRISSSPVGLACEGVGLQALSSFTLALLPRSRREAIA